MLRDEFQGSLDKSCLNILSNLIASERLEIKIAKLKNTNSNAMFHEKLGLMYDADGNVIAFSGSMNESFNAFENNYEAIDVFTSWTSDADRVKLKETAFDSLWNNRADGLEVSDFTAANIYNATTKHVSEILQSNLEKIQDSYNNPGSLRGVPTGLTGVEKVLNGLHKSDLILLAARPSMGKTALALNIAVNAAKKGKVVALFSLEMSCEQIGNRLLSSESKVNSLHLNTGKLANGDMGKLVDALDVLSRLNMYIDDTPGISILDLRSKARRLKHEIGSLDLIVLDYLQLMQGRSNRNTEMNRQQEISEISRSLKALARELNVPILALSQLSRNVEMRAEKKPQLSDLRESGSLEQDADIVLFLYRDEYYNRDEAENENIAELIIAKNRNGPTTSVRLQFQKEYLLFRNLERER